MRRTARAISESETFRILEEGEYGVLSTISKNDRPYGIPLNYCFINNKVYFHSAPVGDKINNIKHNSFVSFTVIGKTRILPENFGTLYDKTSVFKIDFIEVTGKARKV